MKTLLFAAAILVSGSGGLALAQPAGATPEPAPATVPDGAPANRDGGAPSRQAVPAPAPNDPNTTGPDKVNGLEVPQMKDSQDGRRP